MIVMIWSMSGHGGNPIAAIGNGIAHATHSGGGHLGGVLATQRAIAAHGAMRDIDLNYHTQLATHHAALQSGQSAQDHHQGITTIREQGAQTRMNYGAAAMADNDRAAVAGKQARKTIGAQANADVLRSKTNGSQERQTFGYKTRTTAQAGVESGATQVAPSAPKAAAAPKSPAKAVTATTVAAPSAPAVNVTSRQLGSAMKPKATPASKRPKSPTTPTFSG